MIMKYIRLYSIFKCKVLGYNKIYHCIDLKVIYIEETSLYNIVFEMMIIDDIKPITYTLEISTRDVISFYNNIVNSKYVIHNIGYLPLEAKQYLSHVKHKLQIPKNDCNKILKYLDINYPMYLI